VKISRPRIARDLGGRLLVSLGTVATAALLVGTAIGAMTHAQGRAAAGAAGGTRTTTPSPNLVASAQCWRGDFEPGHRWDRVQVAGGSFSVVTSPVRQGLYSGQFTLNPGAPAGGSQGSEVVENSERAEGDDTWMAWSVYFPSGLLKLSAGQSSLFTQWYDLPPHIGPPEVQVLVENMGGVNQLRLIARGGDRTQKTVRGWTLGLAPYDQWVDLRMHVHWGSTNGSGLIELSINAQPVVSAHTPTIYRGKVVYLTEGNYRALSSLFASTLYLDATVLARAERGLSCAG
jgi:Polysaccharide lyase